MYVGGFVSVLLVGLSLALDPVTDFSDVVGTLGILSFVSVPFFFLAGLLRTRLARVGAAQLLQETPERQSYEETEAGLRRALNDPRSGCSCATTSAAATSTPAVEPPRFPTNRRTLAVSRLADEGLPLAAVLHDPALREEPELLEDVLAAARLALVKDRSVEALRASERRNRALLDAMPDNMFRIRGDGTYVDFHSNRPDALTLPPDRIIGSRIGEHVTAGDAAARLATIGRVIATGRAETFELETLDRSGQISQREVRMVKSGEDEVLAISRDIADRKRAEEEIVRQRDFLSTVVNTATSIFCVVTPTGEIVRFNEFCIALTGRADDDRARGLLFWDLFAAPEDVEAVRAAFEADVAEHEHEHRWLHVSGERRLVAWSSTPIVDEKGEQRRLIHGTDVTDRRHQEEELRRSRTRIVEAEAAERRRLERNLHDGAQQRLVSLSLAMRLAQGKLAADPAGASEILRERARRAHARARGASGARARDPSRRADRPRACRSARGAVRRARPCRSRSTSCPSSGFPSRSRQRRSTSSPRRWRTSPSTRTRRSPASASRASTGTRSSRSPTTGSAAPTPPAAPGCADWPTASTHSTAAFWSRALRGDGTLIRAVIPYAPQLVSGGTGGIDS